MPITEKQKEKRQLYLGSSDIAAILGMNPWKTPIDVWNEKVYPIDEKSKSGAIQIGNFLEKGLIEFAAEETNHKIFLNQFRVKGIFGANLDGQAYQRINGRLEFLPIGYEAKTTSIAEGWGDEGTDDVPDYISIQCHHQIYAAALETVFIPVLIPHFGRLHMKLYRIDRDEKILRDIVRLGKAWWKKYVETKTQPPAEGTPSLEILKRIRREPETFAEPSNEVAVNEWMGARQERLDAEKREKTALATILEQLGTAEAARLSDGSVFTYMKQRGADRLNRKLLKSKYPEVYTDVSSENIFRVPRIKPVGREK